MIAKPNMTDVLCGRGRICFHHAGNDMFRGLIAENLDLYKSSPTKKEKMKVISEVVNLVLSKGGRFLMQNEKSDWVDGGSQRGKKKAGHALRDALRGRVKCVSDLRRRINDEKASHSHHANFECYNDENNPLNANIDYHYNHSIPRHNTTLFDNNNMIYPFGYESSSPRFQPKRGFGYQDLSSMYSLSDHNYNEGNIDFIEPETEWLNSKLDSEVALEVLNIFAFSKS